MGKILKPLAMVAAIAANFLLPPGIGQIVSFAITAGISLLTKAPRASEAQQGRLYATIDPDTPRKMVFGRTAMATDIRYQEYTGADQEYLHMIVVVASHRVEAIEELWLEEKLAWSSAGGVQSGFTGYLNVAPVLEGSASNTVAISSNWGASRRLTGCAYVHLRFKLTGNGKKAESPFSGGVPQRMTVVGKGALLYDPRRDSSVGGSGTMRANDQATWAWAPSGVEIGRNAALQELWYLLGWRINGKVAVGRGVEPSRNDMATFITAANACDEAVAKAAGGSEPRYRSDGVFSEADAPGLVFENLLAACNGVLRDVGGRIGMHVRINDLGAPVASFTADDVLDAFTWDQTGPIEESFNIVRGKYTDPSPNALYQPVDYPAVKIASLDGIDRVRTIDLPTVQSPSQAQRLVKQALQRSLFQGVFSADFNATGWRVQMGDVVRLTFPPLGFVNKLFRVIGHAIKPDGIVPMILREEHPAIYAWDAEEAPAITAAPPTVYDPLKDPLVAAAILVDGATAGAVIGPGGNLRNEDGTLLTANDVLNNRLVIDGDGFLTRSGSPFRRVANDAINISQGRMQGIGTGNNTRVDNAQVQVVGGRITNDGGATFGPSVGNDRMRLSADLGGMIYATYVDEAGNSVAVDTVSVAEAGIEPGANVTESRVSYGTARVGSTIASTVETAAFRATVGLDASGNVARPLPASVRVASDILGRNGGGVFTGELAATYNPSERAIIRNSIFEGPHLGFPAGWELDGTYRGGAYIVVGDLRATRGRNLLVVEASTQVRSEFFAVESGERWYLEYRFGTASNRSNGAAPEYAVGFDWRDINGQYISSALVFGPAFLSVAQGPISSGASAFYSPPAPPGTRSGRVFVNLDIGQAGSGATALIDYLSPSSDEPKATVGAPVGTSVAGIPAQQAADGATRAIGALTSGNRLRSALVGFTAMTAGIRSTTNVTITSTRAADGTKTVSISAHQVGVAGEAGEEVRSYAAGTLSGLNAAVEHLIYSVDPSFVGGIVTYYATTNASDLNRAGAIRVGFAPPAPATTGGTSTGGGGTGTYSGGGGGGGGTVIP